MVVAVVAVVALPFPVQGLQVTLGGLELRRYMALAVVPVVVLLQPLTVLQEVPVVFQAAAVVAAGLHFPHS